MDVKINELEEKLKKIEAELLEQEHRPFKILWNYFNRKNRFKDSKDKRRKAVTKAVIWRLFISPTTIAIATSGLLGYLSLFLLYKQTNLFKNQNKFIQQQTHLAEASRRSSQMFIMGEVLSDINTELKDPLNSRDTLSNTLVGRIIGLSRSMKPYKYLVGDSLINKPLSPERGQLLIALVESKIDSTFFVDKILKGSDFSSAELNGANLSGANLNGVNLNMAQLNSANLKNANLKNARLQLFGMDGKVVLDQELEKSREQITAQLPAGIYQVQLTDGKVVINEKLVLSK